MCAGVRAGAAQAVQPLEGDVSPVHDPVVIKEKGTYYVFCTGGRNGQGVLPIRTSTDMRTWKAGRLRLRVAARVGRQGSADGAQRVGAGHLVLQRQVPPLLLGVVVRQPQLRHRSRHDPHARSVESRLPLDRRGDGAALVSGQGRLERDRSQSRARRRSRVARVGQLLGRHQDAPRRSVLWKALRRRRDDALAEQPSARAADQRVSRGSVHRPSRRLLVPVRLVRSLLPRRPEHLQRRRRPLAVGDRVRTWIAAGSR